LPLAGSAAQVPSGWIVCDGRVIDVISQPQLYNLAVFLGKTYDPQKITYRLPDLRSRTLFGLGGNGFSQGQYVGTPSTTIQIKNMPRHSHSGTTSSASNMYYQLYNQWEGVDEVSSCSTCDNAIYGGTSSNQVVELLLFMYGVDRCTTSIPYGLLFLCLTIININIAVS